MFEEEKNSDRHQTTQKSNSENQKWKGEANGGRCDTKPSEIQ